MVGFHHHIYNGALPPIVLLANPFTRQSNPTWPADAIHFSIDFFLSLPFTSRSTYAGHHSSTTMYCVMSRIWDYLHNAAILGHGPYLPDQTTSCPPFSWKCQHFVSFIVSSGTDLVTHEQDKPVRRILYGSTLLRDWCVTSSHRR